MAREANESASWCRVGSEGQGRGAVAGLACAFGLFLLAFVIAAGVAPAALAQDCVWEEFTTMTRRDEHAISYHSTSGKVVPFGGGEPMSQLQDDTRVWDCPATGCYADCNGDTTVNTIDFLCFLNHFTAGDPAADCNGDTAVNTLDILCFLNQWTAAYNSGGQCP